MTDPVAVVDLGTVSTRLLVTGPRRRRETTVTRLGAEVHRTGAYGDEAWARAEPVLARYRNTIAESGVERVVVVATSSARDATDREAFFDRVEGVLGARPTLLSGEEEGRLTFRGATSGAEPGRPTLVIDIGGGSTEFVVGPAGGDPDGIFSADVGAGRLTEAYLQHDPPRPEGLSSALSIVEAHLSDVRRELPAAVELAGSADGSVIGVGGTITTTAAVEIGMVTYDPDRIDGFVLERAAAEDVFRTLATEPLADRVHNPGLHPDRAEVIVGGLCVLLETMRRFGIDELTVSERDLLEGVAASLHQRHDR